MRKLYFLICIIVTSLLLAGCFAADKNEYEPTANLKVEQPIDKITLAKSLAHGLANSETVAEYLDKEVIEMMVGAVNTAIKNPGILDAKTPDYDIVFFKENMKDAYHLWIDVDSDRAMVMDVKQTHTGYTLTAKATNDLKKIIFENYGFKNLEFRTERDSKGDLIAKPIGILTDHYLMSGESAIKVRGVLYHFIQFHYGDHQIINALVAHDSSTDDVRVIWNDKLDDSNNRWNNAFVNNYHLFAQLDDDRLLFLESEIIETGGQYHISTYDVTTGSIERLRENFWPLADDYDYIYQYDWNDEKKKLFLQSFLGNVWIFDLQTGVDDVHMYKYPVIPHSVTGAPSLFASSTLERFVHDDESGQLTFFDQKGNSLNSIRIPESQYIPSEKMKWNPAGTIAWMERSDEEQLRIQAIDIDYLKIAPQQIDFFNPDGLSIGSIQAEGKQEGASVEITEWIDEHVAIIKSYTAEPRDGKSAEIKQKDVSYFLYDVMKDEKRKMSSSIPPDAIENDQDNDSVDSTGVTVTNEAIIYVKDIRG